MTDRDGRFAATGLAIVDASKLGGRGRHAHVGLDVPGFVPHWTKADVAPGAETTIRLQRSLDVAGAVVAEDGSPAGGVRVEADPNRCWTITSSDGRFVLRRVGPDLSRLTVMPANPDGDVARQVVEGVTQGRTDLRIVVRRGRSIAGRVIVEDGRGAPDCVVTAVPAGAKEPLFRATTGGDGSFRVAGLPEGAFDVTVRPPSQGSRYFPDSGAYQAATWKGIAAETADLVLQLRR